MKTKPISKTVEHLRSDCHKALRCMFVEVEAEVAEDINAKVTAYITALEKQLERVPTKE